MKIFRCDIFELVSIDCLDIIYLCFGVYCELYDIVYCKGFFKCVLYDFEIFIGVFILYLWGSFY